MSRVVVEGGGPPSPSMHPIPPPTPGGHARVTEHERARGADLEARLRRAGEDAAADAAAAARAAAARAESQADALADAEARAAAAEARAAGLARALESTSAERDAAEDALADARARLAAVHALNQSVVEELRGRVEAVTALNKSAVGGLRGAGGAQRGRSVTPRGRRSSAGGGGAAAGNSDRQWVAQLRSSGSPTALRRGGSASGPRRRLSAGGSSSGGGVGGGGGTAHSQLQGAYSHARGSSSSSIISSGGGVGGAGIPFVPSGTAGPSHNVLANAQRALSHSVVDTPRSLPVLVGGGDGEAGGGRVRNATRARTTEWAAATAADSPARPASSGFARGASGTAGGPRRGSAVAALPAGSHEALLESLEAEAAALKRQYGALCDAAADGEAGAATAAASVVDALREKAAQIDLLRGAELGTVAGPPVRSPVRNPDAVDRRVETLRTVAHLRDLVGCGC